MKISLSILSVAVVFIFSSLLYAQEVVTTTGGNGSGAGGSVSYTVGQVVNNIYRTSSGSVTEGIQQPYEISVETDVESMDINLMITVFPNPTSDYLTIQVHYLRKEELFYKLYRIDGKLITKGKINDKETKLKTEDLTTAVYLLSISNNKKEIKVFKIVKN